MNRTTIHLKKIENNTFLKMKGFEYSNNFFLRNCFLKMKEHFITGGLQDIGRYTWEFKKNG